MLISWMSLVPCTREPLISVLLAMNASFPKGSLPGTMKITSSAMRPRTVARSPFLLAASHESTKSPIAFSSLCIKSILFYYSGTFSPARLAVSQLALVFLSFVCLTGFGRVKNQLLHGELSNPPADARTPYRSLVHGKHRLPSCTWVDTKCQASTIVLNPP